MMRLKRKDVKREDVKRNGRLRGAAVTVLVLVTFYVLYFIPQASAQPRQEDVFRSIQQNVGRTDGGGGGGNGRGMAILLGGVASVIMALLIGSRIRQRQSMPKVIDKPRKLVREVMKTVPLKPKELKQLKLLAEEGGEAVQSPLTLLLCPSVLAKTLKNNPAKVDRAVVAQLVRKMGVAGNPKQ